MTTPDDHAPDARFEGGHPGELLDAWLDDRLDADDRRRVDEHLAACERCRREVEVLRAAVDAVRTGLSASPAPPGLAARIGAALDAEDARAAAGEGAAAEPAAASQAAPLSAQADPVRFRPATPASKTAPRRPSSTAPRWGWLAAAAAVIAAVALAFWLAPGTPPAVGPDVADTPPVDAAPPTDTTPPATADLVGNFDAAYAELAGGPLPASFETADPAEVENRWQRAGLGFRTRVFDLEAMGIHLAGGDATTVGGRRAAVTAYRGADTGLLACWMFEGTPADLPEGAEVRQENGFEFHVYRRDGRTLVFWQEGDVLCALAGEGDPETVYALAVAKAMAPTASPDDDRAA